MKNSIDMRNILKCINALSARNWNLIYRVISDNAHFDKQGKNVHIKYQNYEIQNLFSPLERNMTHYMYRKIREFCV